MDAVRRYRMKKGKDKKDEKKGKELKYKGTEKGDASWYDPMNYPLFL